MAQGNYRCSVFGCGIVGPEVSRPRINGVRTALCPLHYSGLKGERAAVRTGGDVQQAVDAYTDEAWLRSAELAAHVFIASGECGRVIARRTGSGSLERLFDGLRDQLVKRYVQQASAAYPQTGITTEQASALVRAAETMAAVDHKGDGTTGLAGDGGRVSRVVFSFDGIDREADEILSDYGVSPADAMHAAGFRADVLDAMPRESVRALLAYANSDDTAPRVTEAMREAATLYLETRATVDAYSMA